ncbi:MAG: hypothetical protein ACFFC7_01575 [Candidatus Hermodarchaeota archaeon]
MDIGLEEDIVSVINEITGAWEDLKARSMEMIDEILRITAKLELMMDQQIPSTHFKAHPFLSQKSIYKLHSALNLALPKLERLLPRFEELISRLHKIEDSCKRNARKILKSHEAVLPASIHIANCISEIVTMFENSIHLKRHIVNILNHSNPTYELFSYVLTLWTLEPYIEDERLEEITEEISFLEMSQLSTSYEPICTLESIRKEMMRELMRMKALDSIDPEPED